MTKTKKKTPASVVWFNVPAEDIKRAKKFYSSLFGWKISSFQGMDDFLHIDTGGHDASPDGGIGQRQGEEHAIVNYIGVDSVDKYLKKVQKLGGKVCMPKTAVPQMGYFAVCQDSENNGFGLWERDSNAK
jgi:uncharacterized protein